MTTIEAGLFSPLMELARDYRARRRRARAERILNELPTHLRKDIGWPDGDAFARRARR